MDKLSSKIFNKEDIKRLALGIFNMIGYVNFVMASKYFSL